jgi:transcription initiation factor IIE alpha subunit
MQEATEQAQSCPDCGALVADLQLHERWHGRLVSDLARAVESEIKRTLAESA